MTKEADLKAIVREVVSTNRTCEQILSGCSLSWSQFDILDRLATSKKEVEHRTLAGGGQDDEDKGDTSGSSRVSMALKKMESAGWILRSRELGNQRKVLVSIQPAGKEKWTEAASAYLSVSESLGRSFNAKKLSALRQSLEEFKKALQEVFVAQSGASSTVVSEDFSLRPDLSGGRRSDF